MKSRLILYLIIPFLFSCQHGEDIEYYENGELKNIYNYKFGERHGLYKSWNENGKLNGEGKFENDDLVWSKWYNENGDPEVEYGGVGYGVLKRWLYHKNGKLKSDISRKGGKLDGEQWEYHDNGQLFLYLKFKDGEKYFSECYDRNGNIINCKDYKDFEK